MYKKNQTENENYLDRIPLKNEGIGWKTEENGLVTLEIQNKGFFNRLAQKFFKKPKITYIHLDENGSFIWPLIDGKRDITEIGKLVDEHFGEKAHPLYERLSKFFYILADCKFITWKE